MLYAAGTGHAAPRNGAHHPSIAPYGPFPCGDGAVHLAVQNDPQWRRLCAEVLDQAAAATDPRFATNAGRQAHRSEVDAQMRHYLANSSFQKALAHLEAAAGG